MDAEIIQNPIWEWSSYRCTNKANVAGIPPVAEKLCSSGTFRQYFLYYSFILKPLGQFGNDHRLRFADLMYKSIIWYDLRHFGLKDTETNIQIRDAKVATIVPRYCRIQFVTIWNIHYSYKRSNERIKSGGSDCIIHIHSQSRSSCGLKFYVRMGLISSTTLPTSFLRNWMIFTCGLNSRPRTTH